VNVLQRVADVVVQKSTREGFCLCVTEALWKQRPVVASRIGGIPLQIEDGKSGYLVPPYDTEGFAERIIRVLEDPHHAKRLGMEGKKIVKERFLITRLLLDHLDLLEELIL
jgi:trehalose synthase